MPDLKAFRDYHEAFRRLGIQNPGEVRFGTPINFTAVLDDFSHLQPPLLVPLVSASHAGAGPGAGLHAGIEVEARGRGVWIELGYDTLATQLRAVYPGVARTVTGTLTALSLAGPARASVVSSITVATAAIPANAETLRASETRPFTLFLEPAQRFQLITSSANVAFGVGVRFREVQARGPAPTP